MVCLSPAWEIFASNLESVLVDLEEDQILVISLKQTNLFVQFVGQGAWGLRAETISNYFRSDDCQLTKSQKAWLMKAGWLAPSGSPSKATPKKDVAGSPNYFLDVPKTDGMKTLVELVVATFVEVIDAVHPCGLEYEAFGDRGESLPLLNLGLKLKIDSEADTSSSVLEQRLLDTVKGLTRIPELDYDEVGDISLSFMSVTAYISLLSDSPFARIHSVLLKGAVPSFELLALINDMNAGQGHMHLFLSDGHVVAVSDLLVTPLNASHVGHWIGNFTQIAEEFQTELQEQFGDFESISDQQLNPITH